MDSTTQDVWSATVMRLVQRACSAMTAVSVRVGTTPMATNVTRALMSIMDYRTPHVKV